MADLAKWLTEAGMKWDQIGGDTFRTRIYGKSKRFRLFLREDADGFVNFAIVPFLKSPADPDLAHPFYKRLLELNQSLLMAKFSIDDDLDVVLSVEYPAADLDFSEFSDALSALRFYAESHFDELRGMSETDSDPDEKDTTEV